MMILTIVLMANLIVNLGILFILLKTDNEL